MGHRATLLAEKNLDQIIRSLRASNILDGTDVARVERLNLVATPTGGQALVPLDPRAGITGWLAKSVETRFPAGLTWFIVRALIEVFPGRRRSSAMTIQGRVVQALPGLMGFDTIDALDAARAQQYAARGFRFCIRYVPFDDRSEFVDLTAGEAQTIVDSGLGLMVVQHPLDAGWAPNEGLGQSFGQSAAWHAGQAGLPPGVNVWLDLEGVRSGTPAPDVIAFCNAWFAEVESAGFASGIYIGANPGLTADELYWDIKTTHYWKGGSSAEAGVPDEIPYRGYQLVQRIHDPGPREYDSDVTRTDAFGGGVMWAING